MNKKMKIAHSLEDLEDQVILTLVDRPILNQGKLNEQQDDVLQNQEIQLSNEAKHNAELKSKLKNIADASSSHLQAKNQGLSGILPHYDDYSYKPSTIEVEDGAVIKTRKIKKGKALGSDYQQDQGATKKFNSEYSSRKDQKKKTSKTSTRDLLNFLDETAEDNIETVKRQAQDQDIIKESLDKLKKKRILQNDIKSIVQHSTIDDDEQSMLLKSIERSRKKAETAQNKFNILEAIKEEQSDHHEEDQKKVQIELNPISYRSSDDIRQHRTVELKEAVGGTASVMFAHLPSEKLAKKAAEIEKQQPLKFQDFSKEQLDKMRAQVEFLQDKEVGIGLAGTLAFLRQNSLLGKEQQVGRHNDKTVSYNDPNDRIRLEYRNASGKLMKPKEAYRYICAQFHGEGSGKNKIEIRKRRQLEELRVKQRLNEGGQLLKMLEQHQSKTNEAHLILNIGGKANKPI